MFKTLMFYFVEDYKIRSDFIKYNQGSRLSKRFFNTHEAPRGCRPGTYCPSLYYISLCSPPGCFTRHEKFP